MKHLNMRNGFLNLSTVRLSSEEWSTSDHAPQVPNVRGCRQLAKSRGMSLNTSKNAEFPQGTALANTRRAQ